MIYERKDPSRDVSQKRRARGQVLLTQHQKLPRYRKIKLNEGVTLQLIGPLNRPREGVVIGNKYGPNVYLRISGHKDILINRMFAAKLRDWCRIVVGEKRARGLDELP